MRLRLMNDVTAIPDTANAIIAGMKPVTEEPVCARAASAAAPVFVDAVSADAVSAPAWAFHCA